MTRIKRPTRILPAEPQLFGDSQALPSSDATGPTKGFDFPQWGLIANAPSDKAHHFRCFDAYGFSESLCGRVESHWNKIHRPGNAQHCKDCERRYAKRTRQQQQRGVA